MCVCVCLQPDYDGFTLHDGKRIVSKPQHRNTQQTPPHTAAAKPTPVASPKSQPSHVYKLCDLGLDELLAKPHQLEPQRTQPAQPLPQVPAAQPLREQLPSVRSTPAPAPAPRQDSDPEPSPPHHARHQSAPQPALPRLRELRHLRRQASKPAAAQPAAAEPAAVAPASPLQSDHLASESQDVPEHAGVFMPEALSKAELMLRELDLRPLHPPPGTKKRAKKALVSTP